MSASEPLKPIWDRWISPETLLDQVANTAGFLFPLPAGTLARLIDPGPGPRVFLEILGAGGKLRDAGLSHSEQLQDYFALCLAAHHTTVATFVPTDVDSKIRGHLWRESRDSHILRPMADLAIAAMHWDLAGISARTVTIDNSGPVSGHNGEMLSVLAGAHGRFLELGDREYADRTAAAIDTELIREAHAFSAALRNPALAIETLLLAMSIAHNLGDLDQGISFWKKGPVTAESRARFGRLGHENAQPYNGVFQLAARLYRDAMASEGHRHYPLRGVRALRRSADLLLPLGPFFDEWGATVVLHPQLTAEERAEVLQALIVGCRKVPNQTGYYRAIAGFANASAKAFDAASSRLPSAAARDLRSPEFRKQIAVPRASFESAMRKKVAAIRPSLRGAVASNE